MRALEPKQGLCFLCLSVPFGSRHWVPPRSGNGEASQPRAAFPQLETRAQFLPRASEAAKEPGPAYHRAERRHTPSPPHPPAGWVLTRGSSVGAGGLVGGGPPRPFCSRSRGRESGEAGQSVAEREKCTPQQKVRQKPTPCQAHDQVKFTAVWEGRGAPSQKGAYFEVMERNRLF